MAITMPKLTLQPLVENAIYHGICIKEGNQGKIEIVAKRQEEDILIDIADTGESLDEEQIEKMNQSLQEDKEQFGYGVRNVHKRIGLLFGDSYGLCYYLNKNSGATVEIKLPAHYKSGEKLIIGGRQDV